jgi:hypothetical protein
MALTPEQQEQLDELNRLSQEPDDDEEYEIEIYSSDGSGARLPYKKGKSWLQKTFGIDIGDAPSSAGEPAKPSRGKAGSKAPDKGDAGEGDPENGPQLKLFRQQKGRAAS